MRHGGPEALQAMNDAAGDAVDALCDSQVDTIVYGCLLATLARRQGLGRRGRAAAGAPRHLHARGARLGGHQRRCVDRRAAITQRRSVSMIAPYRKDLTAACGGDDRRARHRGSPGALARDRRRRGDRPARSADPAVDGLRARPCEFDALVLRPACRCRRSRCSIRSSSCSAFRSSSAASASAWALLRKLRIEPNIKAAGWLLRSSCDLLGSAGGVTRKLPRRRLRFSGRSGRRRVARCHAASWPGRARRRGKVSRLSLTAAPRGDSRWPRTRRPKKHADQVRTARRHRPRRRSRPLGSAT